MNRLTAGDSVLPLHRRVIYLAAVEHRQPGIVLRRTAADAQELRLAMQQILPMTGRIHPLVDNTFRKTDVRVRREWRAGRLVAENLLAVFLPCIKPIAG